MLVSVPKDIRKDNLSTQVNLSASYHDASVIVSTNLIAHFSLDFVLRNFTSFNQRIENESCARICVPVFRLAPEENRGSGLRERM